MASSFSGPLLEQELLHPWKTTSLGKSKMTQDDRYYMIFVVVAVLALDLLATVMFLKVIA